MRQNYLGSSVISLALHLGLAVVVLLWGMANPFQPLEISFDEIEVIDNASFEALLATTTENDPEPEEIAEPVPEPVVTPVEPVVAATPENLPEPIFDPGTAPALPTPAPAPQAEVVETPSAPVEAPVEEAVEIAAQSEPEAVPEAVNVPLPPARPTNLGEGVTQIASLPTETQAPIAPVPPTAPVEGTESVTEAPATAPEGNVSVPPNRLVTQAMVDLITEVASLPEALANPAPTAPSAPPSQGDDVIEGLLSEVLEESASAQPPATLSRINQGEIFRAIKGNWNTATFRDKANYNALSVTVEFRTNVGGALEGDIRLVAPNNPSADELVAFEAAKRAIFQTVPFNLPAGTDPDGVTWRIMFDPATNGVGNG